VGVQAQVDAEHGLSDRAAAAKAQAEAKAGEFDQKHGVTSKSKELQKAADAKAAELDAKHGLQARASLAAERAKEAEQAAKVKAQAMDSEYGFSAKAGTAAAMAGASASAAAAQAVQKSREAAHGQIARSFYEFDADGSGYLDESEIGEFCNKLGLLLSPEEVTQALAEMEMDETRDGKIEFDEFLNWWEADSSTKTAGSLAFRLQEAKEKAFAAELAAGTPMGQLLAQKQAAAAAAGAAGASAGAAALAAQESIKKGLHRAQNLSAEEKAKLMSYGSMALSVAMVVCPAGRAAGLVSKGMLAANVAKGAGVKMPGVGGGAEEEDSGPTVNMTMQLTATADAGETMIFKVDGYDGEYKVVVPDGVKKGETFQFDGDLKKVSEGVPPTDYKARAGAGLASAGAMLGGTKAGKKMEAVKKQVRMHVATSSAQS
jgi:hypothetical protein